MQEKMIRIFTEETIAALFPSDRADAFFEALFGGAEDGAYDIRLVFRNAEAETLNFAFELHQRPGKCLACNLTYGLPQVFMRHPVINLRGIATEIGKLAGWEDNPSFRLGNTEEHSSKLHIIPFSITR